MKRTGLWTRSVGLLLIGTLLAAALAGCGATPGGNAWGIAPTPFETAQLGNLTDGIVPGKVTVHVDMEAQSIPITDFALRLLRASRQEDENTLVSPLSVLCALAMTANGAEGETKQQMEAVLGLRTGQLNEYLYAYKIIALQSTGAKVGVANSIWLNEAKQTAVRSAFLQANVDYLDADVYRVPFDGAACDDVNSWVREATDGMIPSILDSVSPEAAGYLINALVFESPWSVSYKPEQVESGVFITEDGGMRRVSFMYSTEDEYLTDGATVGFAKRLYGGFTFVALLPDEHLRIDEFLASLTGETLQDLLASSRNVKVNASLPKFETACSTNLIKTLGEMGMSRLFDPTQAELGGIGPGVYIAQAPHRAYLSVDEYGCKAGAATGMGALMGQPDGEPETVYLDRPFVYMILDAKYRVPLFIGTMMDPTAAPDAD